MSLIARNSGHRKSCWNYNLRCIPKPFGFAPVGAFPPTLQHCLMPFPKKAAKALHRISWHDLPWASHPDTPNGWANSQLKSAGLQGRCVIWCISKGADPAFRSSGSARPPAELRHAESATRSRARAQFQKLDPALTVARHHAEWRRRKRETLPRARKAIAAPGEALRRASPRRRESSKNSS
jgi:hypothetical protein